MDTYRIISCEGCGQKLRIPSDKNGTVTCPKCKRSFYVQCASRPLYKTTNEHNSISTDSSFKQSNTHKKAADELRYKATHAQTKRRFKDDPGLALKEVILRNCSPSLHHLAGYLHYDWDSYDDINVSKYYATLPTIEEKNKEIEKYNQSKNKSNYGPFKRNYSLFAPLDNQKDFDSLNRIALDLKELLIEEGFSNVKVFVKQIKDIEVIEKTTDKSPFMLNYLGIVSSNYQRQVSFKQLDTIIYVLYFEISW